MVCSYFTFRKYIHSVESLKTARDGEYNLENLSIYTSILRLLDALFQLMNVV